MTKIKELAPTSGKFLVNATYSAFDNISEITKSQKITKSCIAYLLLVVYNTCISDTKANKYHVNFLYDKIKTSGGADILRAYFASVSAAEYNNNKVMI